MHLVPRRIHGILDYVVAVVLILAPRLLGLDPDGAESHVLVALGWATIGYSLLTRYELGLIKVIPFGGHLALDVINGVMLAASPWMFQFSERVWVPHLALGVFELIAVALSRREPTDSTLSQPRPQP